MKKILALAAFFLFTSYITAQTTTVTATVVDSDSQAWNNGSWRVVFQPNQAVDPNPADYNINGTPLSPSVTNQSGALSNSAGLSISIYQSSAISPSGSSWNLTICPLAVTACGTLNFQAIGSSMNLSSEITSIIVAPRFRAVANTYGYSDTEAQIQLNPGSNYFNVTSGNQRCWNGSAWNNCYEGGVTAIPVPIDEGGTNSETASGAVSNLLENPSAGVYDIACPSSILCVPEESKKVTITDPPFNAACDASTNDHNAIQAAVNSCPSEVDWPVSTSSITYQCNTATPIVYPACSPIINLQNGILDNTGTGDTIQMTNGASGVNVSFDVVENGEIELDATTGNPVGIGHGTSDWAFGLYNLAFYSPTAYTGAQAINLCCLIDGKMAGIYSNIPMSITASLQATHIELNCADGTQTGLTLGATYIDVFNGLSIADCLYDIGASFSDHTQSLTINSGDFGFFYLSSAPSGAAVFNLQSNAITLNGSVEYQSQQPSSTSLALFHNTTNFQGNLTAYDISDKTTTVYKPGSRSVSIPSPQTITPKLQSFLSDTSTNDIYLGPGTYTSDRLSLNRSNITLHGAGKGITNIQATCPFSNSPQYGSSGGLFYGWPLSGSLSNVHIKDVSFLGCNSSSPITSVSLDGTDATITATNTLSTGNYVVFNMLTGGAVPALNGGGPYTVISSGLSSSQFKVAYTGASGGPYAQSGAYFATTNSAGEGDATKQGIVLDGCNYCSVEDVAVSNMGGESILFAPSLIGDYPIARNDDIIGGTNDSISSNFAYGARFLNNTVKNTFSGNCIAWSGDATVAQGNVINWCTGRAINAGGSGYKHDVLGYDAEISGNIFDNDHVCIGLDDDGATSTVTKLYDIANNTCSNYGGFGFFSTLTQADDLIFITDLNTTATNYGGNFAMLFGGGDGTYFISNSHLIGTGDSVGQQYGIYVSAGSPVLNLNNNIISNNQILDVGAAGGASPTINYGINTFTNGINVPSQLGPASAPAGSCTVNGTWVFSQDGHATYCNSGTWSTVI